MAEPGDAFTPSRPKQGRFGLFGREPELDRILEALRDERSHVVLYAERGRGKTSLANRVVERLRGAGCIVARHTCEAGSTFDSISRGLMRDLPASLLTSPAWRGEHDGCEGALPQGALRPCDIVLVASRLAARPLICVVDEFDRIKDDATRIRLADTIKQSSDRGAAVIFMIVGVSERLEDLLGTHPSIERSLSPVELPLLSDREITRLLAAGARSAGLVFPGDTTDALTRLSRGMPYAAQLVGLRLVQAVKVRGAQTASPDDLKTAICRTIREGDRRVPALYAELTDDGRDAEMAATLKVIASAPRDEFGRFIADVSRESVLIGDLSIEPNRWEQLQQAGIVARHGGAASQRYSFCDRPLLQHALLLSVLENLGRNQAEAETPGRITPANGTDVAAAPRFPQENGIPPFPNSVKGWSSSNDRRPISKVLR